MLETKTTNGHSLISPSGATRWAACPASVRLTMNEPNTTNKAAQRGTDIHQMGEMLLKGEEIIEATSIVRDVYGDEEPSMFWANRDMLEEAKRYAEYVKGLVTEDDAQIIAEASVEILPEYDVSGHIDATVVNGDTLHIVDLKTGRGPVRAENNLQMQLYAIGMIEYLFDEDFLEFEKVVLHIVQDNDMIHNTNSWETTPEDLEEFKEWISERARLALQEDSECVPSDAACQWCAYASKCKALHDVAINLIEDGVDDFDKREDIGDIDVDEVPLDAVLNLLNKKKLIDTLFKAYEQRVETMLLNGEQVEGFKLIKGRKNKRWTDEVEAYSKLKTWLPLDEVAPRKLVTPTQAAKLLGKNVSTRKKNTFDTLYEVPEGELKCVPSSAKGEPVVVNVAAAFAEVDDDL